MAIPVGPNIEDMSQERLVARIQELARRLFTDQRVDDLETWHLAQVVEHCSRAIANVYRGVDLEQILRGDIVKPEGLEDLFKTGPAAGGGTIRRVTRVPDELRGIGDRCLYDIGMAGVRDYHGLSLEKLGIQSYRMAANILSILANERDLRDLFQRNQVRTLPIDEEVAFLRQCAARFNLYAHLLKNLRDDALSVPGAEAGAGTPGPGEAADSRDGQPSASLNTAECRPAVSPAASKRSGPGERLLSRYERILLFANTDIERLREELKSRVIDQDEAVDSLCEDLLLNATGTQPRRGPQSYFLSGPAGVGKKHFMESLARALEAQWQLEVPLLIMEGRTYPRPSGIDGLTGATEGGARSDRPEMLSEFQERSRRSPLSILVVDEVDRAHSQLQKFFISIMDPSEHHENRSADLKFEGCILALTLAQKPSNQESLDSIRRRGKPPRAPVRKEEQPQPSLQGPLSPEFLGRLRTLRFSPLSRGSMEAILDRALAPVFERFHSLHGVDLDLTPSARARLMELGFSDLEGARHLAVVVRRHCNLDVSRKIKQDEIRDDTCREKMLQLIREVRHGERDFEPESLEEAVLRQARIRLPYRRIVIAEAGGEFCYRGEN